MYVRSHKFGLSIQNRKFPFFIFQTNKFTNSGFTPSGLADTEIVCLKVSRFNHSCRSNAFYDIDWNKNNLKVEIKAAWKDIKAGQEITICYHGK